MARKFGIIGYPLSHSFSKKYFDAFFEKESLSDCVFDNLEIDSLEKFEAIMTSNPTIEGLSVTIPHKQNIIGFLDKLSPLAQKIGAVNCVKIVREQYKTIKIGYNTDVIAFQKSLQSFLGTEKPKAIILGNGGAAKAVRMALENLGIEYIIVERNKTEQSICYEELNNGILVTHKLIINTTPLGTFPKITEKPNIPYHMINDNFYGFDLVYNPKETAFIKEFKQRGAKYINGEEMLIIQAKEAWCIYNDNSK